MNITFNGTNNWLIILDNGKSFNLSLDDLTYTVKAAKYNVDNTPTAEHLSNLDDLVKNIYGPCCNNFGYNIPINSCYRSQEVNDLTPGASNTSDHLIGAAMDLDIAKANRGNTNKELYQYIYSNLSYKQVIWEMADINTDPKWVHVSYQSSKNKREALLLPFKGSKYLQYNPTTSFPRYITSV